MKRILILSILALSLLLASCHNSTIDIIGGADGPTSTILGENSGKPRERFGKQLEKRSVRMFNIDGVLYYDSGVISYLTPRCGTMDGELKKAVAENEIPLKSGEANFEAKGYQNATSITKEVNIEGEWIIFKKFDTYGMSLDSLKYCHYIKGHLNNAAINSEIIVLSEKEDVTFNDIYEPLLSSQAMANYYFGKTIYNPVFCDKWGVYFHAENITPKGLTLKIEQFGGEVQGTLQTGAKFDLEEVVNNDWQSVKTKEGDVPLVWNSIAYLIKKNDITELEIDWSYIFGELKPGFYRLKKEIMDFKSPGIYDEKIYEVYFTVE